MIIMTTLHMDVSSFSTRAKKRKQFQVGAGCSHTGVGLQNSGRAAALHTLSLKSVNVLNLKAESNSAPTHGIKERRLCAAS